MTIRPILVLLAALLAAAPAAAQDPPDLRTVPERTGYAETSRYADVMAFLEAADRASERIHLTTFGYTFEGRRLPLAVVGDLRDGSPLAVRTSGKTVVYLQGNIHAGEVEGKEALQELLRAVAEADHRGWLDSLVLLVAPIYNADGNERVNLANRPQQLGPVGGMGQRPNAQGLDLNRDHTKLDSPEARSQAAMIQRYDPHVLVDLHTTNGTFHAYHLTYAWPLHPNTDSTIVRMLRAEWLPAVARRVKEGDGLNMYHYGNVPNPESPWAAARGAERGWYTFDWRPRFSNHYWGLRNRFGILSEAYSYLSFEERIAVTRRFVEEVLDWAAANATRIREATEAADRAPVAGRRLATTARLERSGPVEILMGAVDTLRHPFTGEPVMQRRDVVRPERMPEFATYAADETEVAPRAWLLPPALADAADRLRAHGVRLTPVERAARMRVEEFRIDSTRQAEQPFQGHRARTVWGRWVEVEREVPAGTLRVAADQPLGRLAFTLLEPRSDDGFLAWALLDEALGPDPKVYPILREALTRRP